MRLNSFIKIIELQFHDVVCQRIDNDTSCLLQQLDRKAQTIMAVGYVSSWDHNTRERKRTKYGSAQVTYIRNCTHKGIRTLAVLHGIKLLDTKSTLEGIGYD